MYMYIHVLCQAEGGVCVLSSFKSMFSRACILLNCGSITS